MRRCICGGGKSKHEISFCFDNLNYFRYQETVACSDADMCMIVIPQGNKNNFCLRNVKTVKKWGMTIENFTDK